MTRLLKASQAFVLFFALFGAVLFPLEALAGRRTGGGNGSYIPGPPVITITEDCKVLMNGQQVYVDKYEELIHLATFRKECNAGELLAAQAEYVRSPEYREGNRDMKKAVGEAIARGEEISVSIDEDEAGRVNFKYTSGRAAVMREKAGVYASLPPEAFAQPDLYGGGRGVYSDFGRRDMVEDAFANRTVGGGEFSYLGGGYNSGPVITDPEPAASQQELEAAKAEAAAQKKRADALAEAYKKKTVK